MGITEQLNDLIVRFKLDEAFPHFQKYLAALELIKKLKDLYHGEKKVIIVGADEVDFRYFEGDLAFDITVETCVVNVGELHKLTRESFGEDSMVILVSYDYNLEISCRLATLGIKYVDLYDYFVENGLLLEHAYYKVFSYPKWNPDTFKRTEAYVCLDLKRVTFYQLKKYRSTGSRAVKQILLRKIIFQFLWMKDFIGAEKYIAEYISAKYEGYERYSDFWSELKKFLIDVKMRLRERGSKDALIFCLDAIGYSTQDDLPFLARIKDTSYIFENIFTVTPFTAPTFKTIFCKKNAVDDRSYELPAIDAANSPFLQYLEANQFRFLYFGPVYKNFASKYQSRLNKGLDEAASYIFWSVLEQLLLSKQPALFLIHEKSESHMPYRCADFEGERFVSDGDLNARQEDKDAQMCAAFRSLDEQLDFYMDFLPQDCTRIFMSDHGRIFADKCHTILHVQGKNISPYRDEGLYSYIDLSEIVRCVLEERIGDIQKYQRTYAEIQDVDFYNRNHLIYRIKAHSIGNLISYHGIVTQDSQYIRDRVGNESLRLFHPVSRERGEELINLSKKLCRSNYIDISKDQKFQYSHYLYQIHDRYFARTGAFEEIKRMTVSTIIPPDEEAVWALRPGNESAVRLLLRLSPQQRSRIHYVIDIDSDCAAGKLGYEVLSPDEAPNRRIDKILIHSFRGHSFFKAEHLAMDAQIIDLYDCLEQKGAVCSSDFYRYEFNESDFDIDFSIKS